MNHHNKTSLKKQMATANAYIKNGKFDKAREILKQIDHPTAQKWLNQLDKKKNDEAPPQPNFLPPDYDEKKKRVENRTVLTIKSFLYLISLYIPLGYICVATVYFFVRETCSEDCWSYGLGATMVSFPAGLILPFFIIALIYLLPKSFQFVYLFIVLSGSLIFYQKFSAYLDLLPYCPGFS